MAPFLIDLAGDPATPDRPGVRRLLAALAIGFDRWWLPATYPVAEVRRDVGRKAGLTVEELEQELDDWVAGAPTGRIRAARALDAESREVTEERDAGSWALAAYDAVLRGAGVYRELVPPAARHDVDVEMKHALPGRHAGGMDEVHPGRVERRPELPRDPARRPHTVDRCGQMWAVSVRSGRAVP